MKILFTLIFIMCMAITSPLQAKSLTITTGQWQPYINEVNDADLNKGLAAVLLRQIYSQTETKLHWLYQNYELAYHQILQKEKLASFPYFRTQDRAKQVLYSEPVFYATSYVYFNRQFATNIKAEAIKAFRLGVVAGYSYGEKIDALIANNPPERIIRFATEKQALNALLTHGIDYLPMTESVMNNMLNNEFSAQKQLIQAVKAIQDTASLHLIAAKTPAGQNVIDELNQLLIKVEHLTSLRLAAEKRQVSPDIAKLVTSEGHPAILGQTSDDDTASYYTLPQGSKVLVIQWSDKMVTSSQTSSLYKNMMDLSRVVVLNGPLVGKELLIKNMHIELL